MTKSVLPKTPHPLQVTITKISLFQNHYTISCWKLLKMSLCKTTLPSQNKIVQSQSLQDTTSSQSWNDWNPFLSGPSHPLKAEIVRNMIFSDTQKPSQSRNCSKSVLSRPTTSSQCNKQCDQERWNAYTQHCCHIPMYKYACHIVLISHYTTTVDYIYTPHYFTYEWKTKCDSYLQCYCHIYANNLYAP